MQLTGISVPFGASHISFYKYLLASGSGAIGHGFDPVFYLASKI